MKLYKRVIVRTPPSTIANLSVYNPYLPKIDDEIALKQHKRYIEAISQCDVKVTVLDTMILSPSCSMVEDIVVIIPDICAIFTNYNDSSRTGEYVSIKEVVKQHFKAEQIYELTGNACVKGSDVLMIDNNFFVGQTSFTNNKGIRKLADILAKYNRKVTQINLFDIFSLKSCMTYLQNNTILVTEELSNNKMLRSFKRIIVPPDEEFAINSLWINNVVLVPAGYPRTSHTIRKLGYKVIEVNISEFKKLNAGMNSLSLRF